MVLMLFKLVIISQNMWMHELKSIFWTMARNLWFPHLIPYF